MDALIAWLGQNIAWDVLKKALPLAKHNELVILRRALEDLQNRTKELESDRELLEKIIKQRNVAIVACRKANAENARLRAEVRRLKSSS